MLKRGFLFVTLLCTCVLLAACGGQPAGSDKNEVSQNEIEVIFFADRPDIEQGECTVIRWEVAGGFAVFLGDEEVPKAGERDVCPPETRLFQLMVDAGDHMEERAFEIIVHPPGEGPTEDELREAEASESEATGPREPQPLPEIVPGTPAHLAGAWQRTSGPPGGLGYDIRMDPRNPDVMYVTDAWAGAFKSLDGGASWFPINNGITARIGTSGDGIPVFSLSIDPNNPDTLWAGTQFGGGVFRSDDAGASWRSMSSGIQERALTIRGFTVEPGNSNVVYLAGEISSWEWNNWETLPGLGLDMTKGAVYKTTNGGQSWTRIWYGDNLGRYIWINPQNTDLIYVSTGIFDREAANSNPDTLDPGGVGVLRSRDGGQTWDVLGVENGFWENELQIGSLFMHPENPEILIGAAANDSYLWKLGSPLGGIYLTEDGGDRWERVLGLDNASTVEICESNPSVMYAGSYDGIWRSDDGGHNWQETMGDLWGSEDAVAGFPIDMQCDPRDPMRIFVNNYIGGNFLSEDGGVTWILSSKGYTGALMSQLDVAYNDPAHVISASRMGVFISSDAGENWTGTAYGQARAPEALVVAVDPFDDQHIMAVIGDAGPDPWVSWDEGKSWSYAPLDLEEPGQRTMGMINRIVFSPADPQIVLATADSTACLNVPGACEAFSGVGILRSTDRGQTWSRTSLTDAQILDIKFVNGSLVYAVAYQDKVYRSEDAGQTWALVAEGIMPAIALDPGTDPDILKNYSIQSIAVDPFNHERLLVGFENGGLKLSTDWGETWNTVAAGLLPEITVNELIADTAHEGVFYLGSWNMGVFYTTNGGTSWVQFNTGLSNRAIKDLALSSDGSVLYAAVEGGGVFQAGYGGE